MKNLNAITKKIRELKALVDENREVLDVAVTRDSLFEGKPPRILIRVEAMMDYIKQAEIRRENGAYWIEAKVDGVILTAIAYDTETQKYGLEKYIGE